MTTPKLANLYENNELIDLYQIGNDSETDDTNLGFDIPKRITDFNKGFNNAEEFLSLNDSLVNRFPQFQQPVIDYISNNDSKNLNLVVNNLLDPTNNEISGLYSDVGKGLENNLSKFFELPEEERTNILNTFKKRQGIEDDLSWVTSGEPNPELYTKKEVSQNILKKEQPEVTDNVLKYLGVSRFIRNQQKPRTRIKRDNNFKELTGYSFDDVINGRIELDVIESNEFKQGLDAFYNQHKTNIKIPDKSNLSPFTRQLQSFGYEATGSVALAAATSPLLKAGAPGIALFGITNFIGGYLINEKAQDIRKGQTAGIGSQGQASEGEKLAAGFVEMFPIIGDAKGFAGIRKAAIEGGTLTSVETTVRTLIEENRLPNPTEFFTALGVGGLFGGGFKGSLDFFSDLFAKYGGKSAAEIDASLTKKEKTKINKMVEDFETIKDKETKKVEEKVQEIDNLFDKENLNKDSGQRDIQINPEQVGDKKFTDARVESLINDGSIDSSIKSRTETLDAAIKLKNDPNFQNIVKKIAKDRQANPSDEFQMAIALEITSKNNNILDINQKLLNALNVKNDKEQVNLLTKNFLTEVNKLDEFLTDAIPVRTDQARGLAIMGQSTEGLADMTPEKWNKLTETQKRDWIKLKNGDISVTTDVANKSLKDLDTAVNNALKIYNETGDPKTLNKIFAAVKAAKGDYRKLEKLINYGVLANIANGDVLTKPLMIANEIWLSNILFGIDTHIVNTITAAAETLLVTGNLFLDPKNLFNPRELQVGIQHLMNIHTGFNFALKGAMESFKLESNYFTGSSKLEDFADRFAFSMDGTGFIADLVNGIGKHYLRLPYKALISEDAFLQGININMAAHSGAMLRGIQKGLKGEELKKYVREQADLILETFATKITKRINAVDDPVKKKEAIELYEEVKEFAKRSTFSEDITGGGLINNTTKWLAEGSAKNPLVRRFIPFVRILKNLVGRQVQRTPGIGQLPYLSGFYSDYVNGSPLQRKQLRGQVVFSWLTGAFIWTQMEKYTDPNSDVFLTGGGPTNRTAYSEKWDTGWRPYSVGFKQFNEDGTPKIGEDGNPVIKYYGFTRVDPFSGLLMQYTDAYDISKIIGEGDIEELLEVIIVAGARNITDRLFLQGVNDFAKLIYEPKRAQNWLARTVSNNILFVPSSFTRKAKSLPSDLYDMGLLNWTGVTKEQAYQWRLDLDRQVYKGDEGLVIGNKVKNELTRTLPGYDNDLPPMREHITNKPIFKRQRPGIDLLTWFEVSESKNDPVLSVFGKLGKGVSDPSDTITSFGRSVGEGIPIETVELDTTDMSDLQFIINTIDSKGRLPGDRGYNGKTIKQAMLKYMETDWFKNNFEIIKNERKPWRTHEDIVNGILNGPPTGKLPGFNDINTKYITAGKDKFLNLNPKVLEKHTKLKKLSRLKYIELLRNANQSVEN